MLACEIGDSINGHRIIDEARKVIEPPSSLTAML
jgi:hypothetical protein